MNQDRHVPGASGSNALPIVLGVLCLGLFLVCGGGGAAWFFMARRAALTAIRADSERAEAEMRARMAAAKSAPVREVSITLRPGQDGAVVIEVDGRNVGTVYDMDKVVKPLSENQRIYGEAADAVRKSVGQQKAKVSIRGGSGEHGAGLRRVLAERGFNDVEIE